MRPSVQKLMAQDLAQGKILIVNGRYRVKIKPDDRF